ncbi:DNA-3-methyladenine glycosylase I [Neptuniibacter halophilus]|uniref:DNA-3-methyladenine glycosylase I n=1 Tax=Neptuniibacter halophilus TaxID=651666 RepID=UPI002573B05B|nr:DNA-3-methyladenine glycosylase I [Neptuniibacter halophilus]
MIQSEQDGKKRCFGNKPGQEFYAQYHDNEWGVPVYDDQHLFEMLILEGAQAGLSWETVLRKRDGYRQAFHQFDVQRVADMSDAELEALRANPAIIRNKLKIFSARKNARVFLQLQQEFGSFSDYLWAYVDHKPQINHWQSFDEVPVTTEISDRISKDLKKRGMSFVGSTIIYAYMQGVGLVNDHLTECWCYGRTGHA